MYIKWMIFAYHLRNFFLAVHIIIIIIIINFFLLEPKIDNILRKNQKWLPEK